MKPWSFYWPNSSETWCMDLDVNVLVSCHPKCGGFIEIWWWTSSPPSFFHLRVLWTPSHAEKKGKRQQRGKKKNIDWQNAGNKSQRPRIGAFPAWSGVDHLVSSYPKLSLYIKAKTHWKGTSVHRGQHRTDPHTPSRGSQMVKWMNEDAEVGIIVPV